MAIWASNSNCCNVAPFNRGLENKDSNAGATDDCTAKSRAINNAFNVDKNSANGAGQMPSGKKTSH